MRFLENTDLLKIEDILPFFPDFVVIDDFKEEICTALEGYSAHIDSLKAEMDDVTKNAEAIKQDIAALEKRFITIDMGERCSHCDQSLLTRQFYVFPCQHTFHADCLIGLVSTSRIKLTTYIKINVDKGISPCANTPRPAE
jgi:vacuolar protein sorting-associated protein 18